jgi:alpha-galactosidase
MQPEDSTVNLPISETQTSSTQISRRFFLEKATATALIAGIPAELAAQKMARVSPASPTSGATFLDLLRFPDRATAYLRLTDPLPLTRSQSEWHGEGISIESKVGAQEVAINVHAPGVPVRYIHLRWGTAVETGVQVLGDHWERSYGDLGWRNIIPERVMPWYFATYDGRACHAYGVKTGAGALCFWQIDPEGVSLWLNLSNGGSGVQLGQRTLAAAVIVTRQGTEGDEPIHSLREFCRQMCSRSTPATGPVYGTNDWYYAYGKNTAKQILNDTDFIAELSSANTVRPFSVIDMGWAVGAPAFPNMPGLAAQIRERKVRPGIWIRPLEAPAGTDAGLLMSGLRFGEQKDRARELAYDPTVPEAQEKIQAKVKQVVDWGFDLVKHDYSTYDLLGRWGFEMGAEPTAPGWSFHDQGRTNAEITLDLYQRIRESCHKDTLILGCNTIGHLGQGYFDIQRTGDDTSGQVWERTRRMGVNTLAFRLPQHGTFFVQDADCVGISAAVPWQANRQWLDLLAHSGTALFISPGEGSRVPEHAQEIQRAFQLAASGGDGARPVGYLRESTPQTWTTAGPSKSSVDRKLHYDWCMTSGAFPFAV